MRSRDLVLLVCALGAMLLLACGCGGGTTNPDDDDVDETDLSGVTALAGTSLPANIATGRAGANVTVTDATAAPLAGVVVYLTTMAPQDALSTYPHATTDANGQVTFRGIPLTDSGLRVRMALPNRGSVSLPLGMLVSKQVREIAAQDT